MKRWPLHNPHFWETAPFFRLLLPLVVGIFCCDHKWLNAVNGKVSVVIIWVSFLVYAALVFLKKTGDYFRIFTFVLLHCIIFFCGYSLAYFNDDCNQSNWFGKETTLAATYLVRITDAPLEKEKSWKIPVTCISSIAQGKIKEVSGKAFLYMYKDWSPMLLQKGDSILVPGDWENIKNVGNPFEFDYATYCKRNNIFYPQFCIAGEIRMYAANDPGRESITVKVHNWCMSQLSKYITDVTACGLIQAMLLGDEVNLDQDLRQSYSETGIIHIIAISGGNVSIFFIVISFLLLWLRDKKHLWVKYAIALPLVWFYVLMAGAQPSAMRAAVMFSLLAFGIMLQKSNNTLNLLFATAFLLLCANPGWLFSVGFQLSFVAVLSIILFYKPVYNWFAPPNKLAKWLWSAVAASIAAEILVAPLVIWYFHMFPLLFVVANAAAFMFMGMVLVLGIAVICLSWIPVVAKVMGIVTVWLITWFDKIVDTLKGYNPESFRYLVLTDMELVVTYLMIGGVTYFLIRKHKAALFTGLSAACILLFLLCSDEWERLHQLRLVVYNSARTNRIELIDGKTYTILGTDTATDNKTSYTTKLAHTGWRAWQKSIAQANGIYQVGNKTALILNDDINTENSFPVDYLIVNSTAIPDPILLKHVFSPSLIILDNRYKNRSQDKFKKNAQKAGVAVYSVADEGAFILDGGK